LDQDKIIKTVVLFKVKMKCFTGLTAQEQMSCLSKISILLDLPNLPQVEHFGVQTVLVLKILFKEMLVIAI
jgi:hypothetical protein